MERFRKGNNLFSLIMERRQSQRVLVCFSTRVTKKERILFLTRHFPQQLGKLLLNRNLNRIRIKTNSVQLRLQCFNLMWLRVSNRNHRVTTIQIKVFVTLAIPDCRPLRSNNIDGIDWIDVK